jgi:hypothetical protein
VKTRTTTGLAVIGLLALAACDDSPTDTSALDQSINFDVAMVSADATIEDVQALRDAHQGGFFMDGRSGTRSVTFYDAAGTEQDAYEEMTTETIHMVMEMTRELEREGWTASATRTREMTVTGLEGDETTRTVNGSGSEAMTRSRHTDTQGLRTYEMSGTREIAEVVHEVPREGSYPQSGTITRNMSITITTEANGTETRTREVIITFNGTQYPEMTIDGELFEIDLEARPGERPFRGGGQHGRFGGH